MQRGRIARKLFAALRRQRAEAILRKFVLRNVQRKRYRALRVSLLLVQSGTCRFHVSPPCSARSPLICASTPQGNRGDLEPSRASQRSEGSKPAKPVSACGSSALQRGSKRLCVAG